MSFENLIETLNDPLAADVPLDAEITTTVIDVEKNYENAQVKLPSSPRQRKPSTPIRSRSPAPTSDAPTSGGVRIRKRINYELLNQFLLHCELGHMLHIEKLVSHPNIDINYQNSRGHTPLMVTVIHNKSSKNTVSCIKCLISGGADPSICDYESKTIVNYACDLRREHVLYGLLSCGVNAYHLLLQTLASLQNRGSLNILYALITHFAIEKEFASARCATCNHTLKRMHTVSSSSLKCNIGNRLIDIDSFGNQSYYICGSDCCWGDYCVCNSCFEYGILKYMISVCKDKKYASLSKLEKYSVDKQIRKYNSNNNSDFHNKRQSGLHVYTQFPNRLCENIFEPVREKEVSPQEALIMLGFLSENNDDLNDSSDDSDDDDDDDDDSDNDGGNGGGGNGEAPNFEGGEGLSFMNYILNDCDYWYGKRVLKEKEWREIYWMDLNLQLKWLIIVRYKMIQGVIKCLENDFAMKREIVDDIVMFCFGMKKVSACFIKQ